MKVKAILLSFLVAIAFLVFPVSSRADKVVLKEGKVLHGKITDENPSEITIKLGPNMFLRVDRNKIKKIIRKKKKKENVRTVTMESIEKKEKKKAKEDAGSAKDPVKEQKTVSPPKKKDTLLNIEPGDVVRVNKKDNITLFETLVYKTYKVTGKKYEQVSDQIFNRESGKGFKQGRSRVPGKAVFKASWNGVSQKEGDAVRWAEISLYSTATATVPYWQTSKKVSPQNEKLWNELITKVKKNSLGRVEIYLRAVISAGEALSALREKDETTLRETSKALFSRKIRQAEKRKKGFNRRHLIEP